mmetsp:Transcript_56452/g.132407  ORF Transcript_56452/g.132407 Transcript_56452/m.132407 type:complete len:204 (-) Transcript_56452:147-758(-)
MVSRCFAFHARLTGEMGLQRFGVSRAMSPSEVATTTPEQLAIFVAAQKSSGRRYIRRQDGPLGLVGTRLPRGLSLSIRPRHLRRAPRPANAQEKLAAGWSTPGSAVRCGRGHPQRGRRGEAEVRGAPGLRPPRKQAQPRPRSCGPRRKMLAQGSRPKKPEPRLLSTKLQKRSSRGFGFRVPSMVPARLKMRSTRFPRKTLTAC